MNKNKTRKAAITITEKDDNTVDILVEFFPGASGSECSARTVLAIAALQAIKEEAKRNAEEE